MRLMMIKWKKIKLNDSVQNYVMNFEEYLIKSFN